MSVFMFDPFMAGSMFVLLFLIGGWVGSFVNCAVIRLSKKNASLFGRSRCPKCGHSLGFFDLIPIFSWLFLRGKCRYCGSKINLRYILVEICFGIGYCGILAVYFLSWQTLKYILMFTLLCAEALSDIETFQVPDSLHLALILVFLVFLPTSSNPLNSFITSLLAFFIYGTAMLIISLIADKICKKESLGGADIKLFAVLGLYFGPVKMLLLIFISSILGLLAAAASKKSLGMTIPFIPSVTFAAWICTLFADPLINWYLGLFS